jgi:methionine-rich copper-binding protein CopC
MGAGAFAVSATSPLAASVVSSPVARVVISFSHEVDLSLVNDTTVSLERLADVSETMDNSAANVRVSAALSVPQGNTSTLLITPSAPLANGTYQVTLRGTGGGALADVDAQGLGTDYSFSFTVDVSQ